MTKSSQRRRAVIWVTGGLLSAAVISGLVLATRSAQNTPSTTSTPPANTAQTTTSTVPRTVPSTTTSIVVEYQTLPPGTHEVATVRSQFNQVQVQSEPPAGWNTSLTPVITSADPVPPRSGQDLDRVLIPSAEIAVSGRRVTPTGWIFSNPSSYTPPQPLLFGVVARQGGWTEVELPVRPNGTTGWIKSDLLVLSTTQKQVVISLSDRSLRVIEAGQELFAAPISIGRPSSPTPTGSFYVTDIVPSANPAGGYGPVALALNGYSEAMDTFGGENAEGAPDSLAPVLAIHGTNKPASIGRSASNGCPRLFNEDILRLATLVPAGTPVEIWP
ncbi:Ykud domain-containing protein [Actinobacteria bacterium IMCC26207]|nr:Ykud domain-containing protein [Actinobacteria bacterium IMCC26207]